MLSTGNTRMVGYHVKKVQWYVKPFRHNTAACILGSIMLSFPDVTENRRITDRRWQLPHSWPLRLVSNKLMNVRNPEKNSPRVREDNPVGWYQQSELFLTAPNRNILTHLLILWWEGIVQQATFEIRRPILNPRGSTMIPPLGLQI